jgi:hypothetical protein
MKGADLWEELKSLEDVEGERLGAEDGANRRTRKVLRSWADPMGMVLDWQG